MKRQVVKIEQVNSNGTASMKVTTRADDGALRTKNYAQVIATVPLGALQTIDTDGAGLLYSQREAVRSLYYNAATKIGIKFEKRWWQDPAIMGEGKTIRGGQSATDLPIRACVYPSYGVDCPDAPGVLLASYSLGQDAQRIGSLAQGDGTIADKDLLEITLSNLEKLHGIPREKFGEVLDHKAHAWYNDRYTRGAFAHLGPGQIGSSGGKPIAILASLKAPAANGKMHIAGEATSIHNGWILGALNSAWRAVFNAVVHDADKRKRLVDNWGVPDEESERTLYELTVLAEAGHL